MIRDSKPSIPSELREADELRAIKAEYLGKLKEIYKTEEGH
jgi:hypothetical protein